MSTTGFSSDSAAELNMDDTQSIQMTHGTSFEDVFSNTSIMDGLNGFGIILQLVFFLLYAYFQYILSKKLDVKYSWMAWIPVLNFFNKLFIAGKTVSWWLKWFVFPIVLMILAGAVGGVTGNEWIAGIGIFILIIVLVVGTVKINHGVSIRTGHSGWWTAGLMFAGWLFWPVTALHYEKGDEVTPRPFTGWRKGLLIFFALGFPILLIFGIIAAAIYPSMSGYLGRSRDIARMSNLIDIQTSLGAYYADKEKYPKSIPSGCFPAQELKGIYMPRGVPVDPKPGHIMPGCDGSDGTFAYRTIIGEDGIPGFVIGAKMENDSGGNSNLSIDEIKSDTVLTRGIGQYYYLKQ